MKARTKGTWSNRLWAIEPNSLNAMLRAEAPVVEPEAVVQELPPYTLDGRVAVMSLIGPVVKFNDLMTILFGGVSTVEFQDNFTLAANDSQVDAILIYIDSPGGSVAGTVDLADAIAACPKPVYAYICDNGYSAAYWLASQCDKVYINRAGSAGSIGVYATVYDESKRFGDEGVTVHVVKAGQSKGACEPGTEVTPDQLATIQREIDSVYKLFVSDVAKGRGLSEADVMKLATGEIWIAAEALAMGLVDGIASNDEIATVIQGLNMADEIKDDEDKKDEEKPVDEQPAAEDEAKPDDELPVDENGDPIKPEDEDEPSDDYAKGVADERARLEGSVKACKGDMAFAFACYRKGMSIEQAKLSYADKAIKDAEALRGENAKLKAQVKGGADPIRVGNKAVGSTMVKGEDAIKANWESNADGCRDKYRSFDYYRAVQKHSK